MPIIKLVNTPDCEWGVFYCIDPTHPLISRQDFKVWEGQEYYSNGFYALAEALGSKIEYHEFTDEDEIDGCTPDKFGDIIGITKL